MIKAEIITIGDEILFGQITDTNTQWISSELSQNGIKTIRKTSVGDVAEEITSAIHEAFQRADFVCVTGGLGPTKDDITKKTIADYFGVELILNEDVLRDVTEFFESRNRTLTEINKTQALIPANAQVIKNVCGTAAGMWFEKNGKILVSMPGVPFEMKTMMKNQVLERLKSYFKTPIIFHKVIMLVGIGESYLADMISEWEDALPKHIKLAYLPSVGILKLRLTGYGDDFTKIQSEVNQEFEKVKPIINNFVYGFEDVTLEQVVGELLLKNGYSIGTAESCTGGYISHLITSVPGSSAYFQGSIVSYSNQVKIKELGVSPEALEKYGAVSEEVVIEMAKGLKNKLNVEIAVSVSGIAGPEGGTEEKPVGTVWLAIAFKDFVKTHKLQLGNHRENNIKMSAIAALNLVRKTLE